MKHREVKSNTVKFTKFDFNSLSKLRNSAKKDDLKGINMSKINEDSEFEEDAKYDGA